MKHIIALAFTGLVGFVLGRSYGHGEVAVAVANGILDKEIERAKKESENENK